VLTGIDGVEFVLKIRAALLRSFNAVVRLRSRPTGDRLDEPGLPVMFTDPR
jgi:hypothetical protein